MSAARTDWKSLPLEEKPLKERKPKPPSDEGGRPRRAGGRDFAASFYLRCGIRKQALSPSQLRCQPPRQRGPKGAAQKPAPSEGAKGCVSKACLVRGGQGVRIQSQSRQRGPGVFRFLSKKAVFPPFPAGSLCVQNAQFSNKKLY